jgi:radical SAM superfamily enzyme YgiQ (UPF0313 family)
MPDASIKNIPAYKPLRVVLVAVHLEEGPEAIPLGAACVAAALKAAFSGAVPGGGAGMIVDLAETFAAEGAAALIEKIFTCTAATASGTAAPSAIGFSLYSWNRAVCLEAAAQIRRDRPGVFLFCGGPEVTALPGGLSCGGPFDAVIRGEGELAAVELFRRRFFGTLADTSAQGTEPPAALSEGELALLPSPWLDGTLAVRDRPGILWELARGCPYSCAYCYESKGQRHVRYIPEDRLRRELKLFVKASIAYQAGAACQEGAAGKQSYYIFVLDPTFNTDNKRALTILDMILEETGNTAHAADMHWHFEARAELLTREQARRFARLGASLQIGLQTADPKVSALLGRDLEEGKFSSKINLLNEEGVSFGLDLIYGLPGDTLAGYRRSLDFALSLYPNSLDLFRLSVLPGTGLADRVADYGLRAESTAPYMVLSTPDFSAADLVRAETLSRGTEIFYNRGRAVAWFNQVLYPLGLRPSAFLDEFTAWLREKGIPFDDGSDTVVSNTAISNTVEIEKLQLAFLERQYAGVKKEKLLAAIRDIVRYHGAWGRALAEGLSTDISFNYEPEAVLCGDAMDIENFAATVKPRPTRARLAPGPEGPELLVK